MFNTDRQRFDIPSGTHTERQQPREGPLERFWTYATGPAVRQMRAQRLRLPRLVRMVTAHGGRLQQLGTHQLGVMTSELRCQLRRQGFARHVTRLRRACGQ